MLTDLTRIPQQKLLDLFSSHVQIDPPVTPSVFWKYTKREVYTDKNLHRNRKMGGFKGKPTCMKSLTWMIFN
jgi:hypothetical protein